MKINWLTFPPLQLASAPLWHPDEKVYYYSDVAQGKLFRFSPENNEVEVVLDDGRPVGAMTLQEDGSLLLFRDSANVVVFRNGAIDGVVINAIGDYRQTRFSSAVADAKGRVICSVISDVRHTGRLLICDLTGRITFFEDGFGVPAGMAFSSDGSSLYFNDSHRTHLSTWCYHYDADAADPFEHGRTLFHGCFDDGNAWPGAPDGIAVTDDGSLWISRRDGAMLVRHDTTGALVKNIHLHVRKPGGLCFGGDDMTELLVTTSSGHRKTIEGLHAGDLALLKNVGKGVVPFRSKILLA